MNDKLIIIGAGGHGRVIGDVAALCGYESIAFLDDSDQTKIETLGKVKDYRSYIGTHCFIVGIGDNNIRRKIVQKLKASGAKLVSLVHPSAVIGSNVTIGEGTVVMANAVINTNSVVGDGVIINTCSSVDHDNIIGDFSHISVGAHLAGTVTVGENTMVGAGSTVIENITVCGDCRIGAGAVVLKSIECGGTYVGVPAKMIKNL